MVIDAFSEHGSVSRFKMITDRETGRPRGFGFITMDDPAQAEAAINAMDGQDLGGRAVRVHAAQPKSGGGGWRASSGSAQEEGDEVRGGPRRQPHASSCPRVRDRGPGGR